VIEEEIKDPLNVAIWIMGKDDVKKIS